MTAGAPSKITPDLLAKAKAYADGGWKKFGVVPTVEKLALELGLYRSYVYAVPELSDTLEQIQSQQASEVINKGLTGEFNANIGKLLLSSKHGYVEKSAVDSTVVADVTSKGEQIGSPQLAQDFANYMKQTTKADDA